MESEETIDSSVETNKELYRVETARYNPIAKNWMRSNATKWQSEERARNYFAFKKDDVLQSMRPDVKVLLVRATIIGKESELHIVDTFKNGEELDE
jgi:hypothetical protein